MDSSRLEIWGGIECTVARIGDAYVDQTIRTGHHDRLEDLERIASLGISHLRYPVIWERVAPDGVEHADWSWTDERLARLRELNVTPIVTLLHHGSGPRDTNLLDPKFPRKLASFARAVARRYPWIQYYTPVNEPLTTARFAALYGWWYPHERDEVSFYRALLNQIAGIRAAMHAIREECPRAKLVATEDLGKTYATPRLQYQAEHENARRFLTYDLLCDRFDANPHMRYHLLRLGFSLDERALRDLVCPPDVLGFNYYVTGERWLDERVSRYPGVADPGNAIERYVDVEAARVCVESIAGAAALLRECWERYGRTLAITEAHLASTREEQLRWIRDMHRDALALRAGGVDLRAMTVWSLFGAFDWNSALTRQDGYYESGAFDSAAAVPRETAIAQYVRTITGKSADVSPALEGLGWWRTPSRIVYPAILRDAHAPAAAPQSTHARRPIVIVGAEDPLADVVAAACQTRSLAYELWTDPIEKPENFAKHLLASHAWAVFDCTGTENAWRSDGNGHGLFEHFAAVARAVREAGLPLVAISSPLVFDGRPLARTEDDMPCPDEDRGLLYAEIEELLKLLVPKSLILRCGIPFAGATRFGWHDTALLRMLQGQRATVFCDYVSAVHRDDLARVALDLLIDGECGPVHVFNPGESSAMDILDAALRRMRGGARIERVIASKKRRRYILATKRITPPRALSLALEAWSAVSGPAI